MGWFNYYGLIFVAVILIPNIIYAIKNKDGYSNSYDNKAAYIFEQIGRYGCMILMVFNIPYTYTGFILPYAEVLYLVVNGVLTAAYCAVWGIMWRKTGIVKALILSVIPSIIFLFSAVTMGSIPLAIFAVIFAVTHILISVKNAVPTETAQKIKGKSILTVTAVLAVFAVAVVGTLGGVAINGNSDMANLDGMSVEEMIKYDVSAKGKKVSVAVIEGGNITYKTYGSDGEEEEIYDYEIGSVSKTFVGLMYAKAVSEEKISLSDSIAEYLPLDKTKYYPTVGRLLTHTSGYAGYYFEGSMIGNKLARITNDFYGISKEQILDRVKSVSLEDKDYPFEYSNFGISVLGLVLENVYNRSFTELMNDFILNDLNLTRTAVAKQSGNLDKYWKWSENDGYIPAGAIVSNIKDMASYLKTYMDNGLDYAAATYANPKTVDANRPAYEKLNIRLDAIGMTWISDNVNNIVWHDGGTTDFNSYMGFTRDLRKGVVILSNLSPREKISMTVIGAKILTE